MNLFYNGEACSSEANDLHSFLSEKELADKPGIAVALNENVIQKDQWNNTALTENDRILVITATQGG